MLAYTGAQKWSLLSSTKHIKWKGSLHCIHEIAPWTTTIGYNYICNIKLNNINISTGSEFPVFFLLNCDYLFSYISFCLNVHDIKAHVSKLTRILPLLTALRFMAMTNVMRWIWGNKVMVDLTQLCRIMAGENISCPKQLKIWNVKHNRDSVSKEAIPGPANNQL